MTTLAGDLYCPECGYDLRARTSERCAECGLPLDFLDAPDSTIPWLNRARRGWAHSYYATMPAVGNTRFFCREIYRPVSHRDAQLYRLITIAHVCVAWLLVIVWGMTATGEITNLARNTLSSMPHLMNSMLLEILLDYRSPWNTMLFGGLLGIGGLLGLLVFTGVPSYFFHPAALPIERQNRAVALSYYGCGSLAVTPYAVLAALLAEWLEPRGPHLAMLDMLGETMMFGAAVLAVLAVLRCWYMWSRLARFTMPGIRRTTGIWVVLPALWLCLIPTAIILPLTLLYPLLIAWSLAD